MMKKIKTIKQRQLDRDFQIIFYPTLLVLFLYTVFQGTIHEFIKDVSIPILLRTIGSAFLQFGIAGLGISILMVYRKESFQTYGLQCQNIVKTVILSFLCFIPYLLFTLYSEGSLNYEPLSVMTTKEVLESAFPVNVIGMLCTALAWGFFEGFNYVVIASKINQYYPSKHHWLNWGAIVCAIFCILIHGFVGISFSGILGMISVFIIIYGMLVVKDNTGNGWGCIALFVLMWNAF